MFFTGSGRDTIYGDRGNDTLSGGGEDDRMVGGAGCDWLDGGAGRDLVSGGAQADVFGFGAGGGSDVISDFQVGVDHLQINWAERIKIVAAGEDCEIHFGPNVVVLQRVAADGLSSLDFL